MDVNKAELYYFSGTGNSLHVAKELQNRIPMVLCLFYHISLNL
ncbi:hypothetical protein Bccel_1273 [Pseudobacteroides cellulosolvens ATCC 35603 = DSM 2933]|uniref:Uncharacterized protein n=1 Tax=Pseudobacteroides cellulosolvens ATCC 35603 = DSM 2933 TaxID=398512 RepID=A0A0L6JJF5_9FIRM|nr:hypothetical protein Bccel_1273 [Pseudobacteroides cellulosolvens ATCC 35603 = DSM 2933]